MTPPRAATTTRARRANSRCRPVSWPAPTAIGSARPRRCIGWRASPTAPATPTRRSGWRWRRREIARRTSAHAHRGVGGSPDRHRALPGQQLLRGARALPAGARDLSHHRPPGRRGQHLEHGRRHLPLDGRQRPGDRHLRVGVGRQRAARTLRLRRARARQHRPDPCVAVRVPPGRQSRPAGGRPRPQAQPDIVSNLLADLAEAYMGLADHRACGRVLRRGPAGVGGTCRPRHRAGARRRSSA